MIFSSSRLKTFNQCEGKFKLKYIEEVKEEQNLPAEIGKQVHLLALKTLQGLTSKTSQEQTGNGSNRSTGQSQDRPAEPEAIALFNRWTERFLPDIDPQNLLHSEQEFQIKIGKHEVHGFMDRCEDIGGFLTVTDIKTTHKMLTNEELRRDVQAMIYCVAAMKIYPGYDEVVFRIESVRHGIHEVLELTKEEVAVFEETLEAQLDLVSARLIAHERGDKNALPYRPGAHCEYCGLFQHCEAGKKALKPSKTPKNAIGGASLAEKVVLLENHLKEAKSQLKAYCEQKGPVTVNGLTFAFWPFTKRVVHQEMLSPDLIEQLQAYMKPDTGSGSDLWENESLVAKLKAANAITESGGTRFESRKAKAQEED